MGGCFSRGSSKNVSDDQETSIDEIWKSPGIIECNEQTNYMDRISKLPDELLGIIISFLPVECAVKTRLVSRRWRHVYSLTNTLSFQGRPFDRSGNWETFLHGFLKLQKAPNITKLSLAYRRKFSVLDVPLVHVPLLDYLPNLKFVSLQLGRFRCLMNQLFSKCPLLEDLSLKCGYLQNFKWDPLELVSLPRIKRLSLQIISSNLLIDAPNLESFTFISYEPAICSLKNSPHLINTFIENGCLPYEGDPKLKEAILEQLTSVRSTKVLHLSGYFLQQCRWGENIMNSVEHHELPMFGNLETLTLAFNIYTDWSHAIAYLLTNAPQLETLNFLKGIVTLKGSPIISTLPSFHLSHLKEIEVDCFDHDDIQERQIMKHLLDNTSNLEQLILTLKSGPQRFNPSDPLSLSPCFEEALSCGVKMRQT